MAQQVVTVKQNFQAPAAAVFAVLSDHNRLSEVFGAPVKRIKDGADAPNGVGSVRRMGPGPIATQETVTAIEPGKSIDYVISRFGGPIVNHQGRLDFADNGEGSSVTWVIQFDTVPRLLGKPVNTVLSLVIGKGLQRLAKKLA